MKIAISSDHAGYLLKRHLAEFLGKKKHKVTDLGTDEAGVSVDYPDFAEKAARAVVSKKADRAIIICGSGVGASVTANKIKGARAGLCHDCYSARQGVEHDDINILCLGAKIIGTALAEEIAVNFLKAKFSGEKRHRRRLAKIARLEK